MLAALQLEVSRKGRVLDWVPFELASMSSDEHFRDKNNRTALGSMHEVVLCAPSKLASDRQRTVAITGTP